MDRRRLRNRMMNAHIDLDDDNDNAVDVPPDLPIAIPLMEQQLRGADINDEGIVRAVPLTERVSPFLLHLLRENPPCNHFLPGIAGCNRVIERCREHPEEVLYRCPETGRTVLHEACAHASCCHVVNAILNTNAELTSMLDFAHSTPLHLWFGGLSARHMDREESDQIIERLLRPQPGFVASVRNREGCTPLHNACSSPEGMVPINAIKKLLEAHPAAASRLNSQSKLPIHLHCSRPNASVQTADALIDGYPEGLRMLDQSDDSWSPLHYACAQHNLQLIRLLLNKESSALRLRSRNGDSPLHLLCRQKLSQDHLFAIETILNTTPDVGLLKNNKTRTPLHTLSNGRSISFPVVETFLRICPSAASVQDDANYLPLHYACAKGADFKVIQALVDAFPRGTIAQTKKNDTALSLACSSATTCPDTIRILLESNPKATSILNDYGFNALHCICRNYQPSAEITRLLLEADPSSVGTITNSGETAMHLASSNSRTSVAVLQMLTAAQQKLPVGATTQHTLQKKGLISSSGTPLHNACWRGTNAEQIEALVKAHPEWISVKNNAGYSPLQILCKSGRIDENLIILFSRVGGPEVFQTVDRLGNTPLHSAIREENTVDSLMALIAAFPGALHKKTAYNDMPIHLACFRRLHPKLVYEIALATCKGADPNSTVQGSSISPLLTENTAGQSPISIAIEEYEKAFEGRSCFEKRLSTEQEQSFEVLSALCKIIHTNAKTDQAHAQNLLHCLVGIHRKNIRLDPAFIRRAIMMAPEEAMKKDNQGNFPLAVEAMIPMEKMTLLSGPSCHCCVNGNCHDRVNVLGALLDIFPAATKHRSSSGDFPLTLMVQNGRPWDRTFAMVLSTHPEAFHWIPSLNTRLVPRILERVSKNCGHDTLFSLIQARPDFLSEERVQA